MYTKEQIEKVVKAKGSLWFDVNIIGIRTS